MFIIAPLSNELYCEAVQHMYGEAVDIAIPGVTASQLVAYFKSQPGVRYTYAINNSYVHFDVPKGDR